MSFPQLRGAWLLGLFCFIPLLNFPLALISDRTLFARDIGMVWAPQVEAVIRQVGQGEAPFFDARRAFGQPLFADPRAEVLYPPAWIHWILPMETSYPLFAAFHLVLGALGAARLARRLVPGCSLAAEAAAGFIYAAGGPLLSLVSHWHHLAAAAWMPWILEAAEGGPDRKTGWVRIGALTALQLFAGSPDYTFLTLLLCFLRLAVRDDRSNPDKGRVIVALAAGIGLAGVQLLPSLAFARAAARDPLPLGWAISPLHPALNVETILPVRVETWPLRPDQRNTLLYSGQVWMFSHYLGLSAWALAVLGVSRAGVRLRRFAIGSIALGLILAGGVRNESLQAMLSHLPLVPGLRFPTKHLAATSLGLALLAAQGLAGAGAWPARTKAAVLAGATLAVAWCSVLFWSATNPGAGFDGGALVRPALALTTAGVVVFVPRVPWRAGILVACLIVDLLGGNSHVNATTPSSFFRDRPPLTTSISKGARLYTSDYSIQLREPPTRPPAGEPYALASAPRGFTRDEALALAATWYLNPPSAGRFGYFGSFDLDVLDFYPARLKSVIRAFVTSRDAAWVVDQLQRGSVDYVVTMDPEGLWSSLPMVAMEKRFFAAPVRVYRVPDTWPRVRLERGDGTMLETRPLVLEHLDGRLRTEVESGEAASLVVATAWDSGWRATVDGADVEVRENSMAFVSVPLGAGRHAVDIVYRPPFLVEGAAVSALSLLAVLSLAARSRA